MLSVIVSKMNQLAITHVGRSSLGAVTGDIYQPNSPGTLSIILEGLYKMGLRLFSNAHVSLPSGYFLLFS